MDLYDALSNRMGWGQEERGWLHRAFRPGWIEARPREPGREDAVAGPARREGQAMTEVRS